MPWLGMVHVRQVGSGTSITMHIERYVQVSGMVAGSFSGHTDTDLTATPQCRSAAAGWRQARQVSCMLLGTWFWQPRQPNLIRLMV